MRFSTGLLASLAAAQAVFSTPVQTPKTPTAVSVALSVVQGGLETLDTQKADLGMSWIALSSSQPSSASILLHTHGWNCLANYAPRTRGLYQQGCRTLH